MLLSLSAAPTPEKFGLGYHLVNALLLLLLAALVFGPLVGAGFLISWGARALAAGMQVKGVVALCIGIVGGVLYLALLLAIGLGFLQGHRAGRH